MSSARQPQLITHENEGGDETNYPSPPNSSFFDDPDVPFGPSGPPAPPDLDRQIRLDFRQDGLQLVKLLVIERVGNGNTSRERLPLRTIITRASTYSNPDDV